MIIENGDLLTLDGEEKSLVIDNILFEGKKYIFTNKIINDNPTQEYEIYEVDNDELEIIDDEKTIEILMPMFNNNVKKMLEEINNEEFNVE